MKRLGRMLGVVLVLFVLATGIGAANISGYLEIKGSDTMVNLGQTWAEAFMDRNPQAVLAVTGGGSGTGIAGLINDNVDIAQSSRSMRPEEMAMARENDVDVYEFVVAQDGLAVSVNQANPRTSFTVAELKAIFTGEITDWAELGWDEGGTITVYSRQSNSGTYVYINENIMDGEDWAPDALFLPGSSAINESVKQSTSGIGYYGVGYVEGVTAVRVALDEDAEAYSPLEREHVDSGRYPIARPLYFYLNGVPEGLAETYLEWILSDEGQEVIADIGFYALTPQYVEANEAVLSEIGLR